MITVIPSLPAQSYEELAALSEALKGSASELQVDIVDGKFVPSVSWPFTEAEPMEELKKLKTISNNQSLAIDCMIAEPEQYLDLFVSVGAKRVIVHMGSTKKFEHILNHAKTHGYKVGLACTNDTYSDEMEKYIGNFDYVQVMGIRHVGQQGQPFDERTPETVRALRAAHPDMEIAVDGGVNKETIPKLKQAGANRFAPGSAVAKQADPKAAYEALVLLAGAG